MQKPQLSLVLLKKLVVELEAAVDVAEKVRSQQDLTVDTPAANEAYNQFFVEMSKVSGLCSYLASEANALTKDCAKVVQYSRMPERSEDDFSTADLFGGMFPQNGKLGN